MTEKKHTPTPWSYQFNGIYGPKDINGNFVRVADIARTPDYEENGKFIRLAINSYYDLVAALEYVQSVARDAGLQSFGLDTKYIDSVLAKAKGE